MIRTRRLAHAALALVLSVFAVASHHHDGLGESLARERVVQQIGGCERPSSQHFHAAQPAHTRPCVACVRQHSAGTFHAATAVAPRMPAAHVAFALLVAHTTAPSILATPLRGPPV